MTATPDNDALFEQLVSLLEKAVDVCCLRDRDNHLALLRDYCDAAAFTAAALQGLD